MVRQRVVAASLAGLGLIVLGTLAGDGLIRQRFDISELLAAALVFWGASLLAYAYLDERRRVGNLRRALWRRRSTDTRLADVLEQINDIIVRRNGGGRVTYANPAFCEVFGLAAVEILGKPFEPAIVAGDRSPFADRSQQNSGVLTLRYEQCLRTRFGNRWYSFEDSPIRNLDGTLIEIQSVGRDITDRKQMEMDLKAGRDLAEEGSQAKSMFLATMSHEIRTPMNGVLGMANLLLGTELTPEQKTYARAVLDSGEALMALINDILDFSKIESGRLAFSQSDVALRPLIQNVTELLSPRAFEKGIALQSFVAPDVPAKIIADEGRLRQVILNLAGNAIKFTDTGAATIELSCESAAEEGRAALRLVIRDTGVGIPEEARARVFAEFEQADGSTKRRFGGTGLGLAISKRIVEAMNGRIELSGNEGGGSVFTVRFAVPVAEPAARLEPVLSDLKVLIVSNGPLVGPLLARELEAAGASARACESGAEALTLFSAATSAQSAYTTIVVDETLPDGQADSLIEPMRQGAKSVEGGLRVILLLPVGVKRGDLKKRGFDGYLVKPVRPTALIQRVALLHGRGAGETEDDRQPKRTRGRRASKPDRKALSVLLAEDNDINALLVIALLAREGHTVERVANGQEALDALGRKAYDLVLMDVHMPVMDGLAATRAIRAQGRTDLPIVALTANAMDEDRRICLDAGMDDYLAKPIDPDLFEALIERFSAPAGTSRMTGAGAA